MKKSYQTIPESMANMPTYGFSWMEFVAAIPAPLFVVTTYKSNGKPNACLQSWSCFQGSDSGFHAILSSVNKSGHLYRSLRETEEAVINFPSADIYDKCLQTIAHNGFDEDEIAEAGLTAEPALTVNAPSIAECFMNLECRFMWQREIVPGDSHVLMCLEVTNVRLEENHMDEAMAGRYGQDGILYNIHHPVNPERFSGKSHDWLGALQKFRDMGEY